MQGSHHGDVKCSRLAWLQPLWPAGKLLCPGNRNRTVVYKVQFCRRSPVRSPVQNLYGNKGERRHLLVTVFFTVHHSCKKKKKPNEEQAWDEWAFSTQWTVNDKIIGNAFRVFENIETPLWPFTERPPCVVFEPRSLFPPRKNF